MHNSNLSPLFANVRAAGRTSTTRSIDVGSVPRSTAASGTASDRPRRSETRRSTSRRLELEPRAQGSCSCYETINNHHSSRCFGRCERNRRTLHAQLFRALCPPSPSCLGTQMRRPPSTRLRTHETITPPSRQQEVTILLACKAPRIPYPRTLACRLR